MLRNSFIFLIFNNNRSKKVYSLVEIDETLSDLYFYTYPYSLFFKLVRVILHLFSDEINTPIYVWGIATSSVLKVGYSNVGFTITN
jgi:hypothetical protein